MSEVKREIDAHLRAFARARERGDVKKQQGHLTACAQLSEAAGIPNTGQYDLTRINAQRGKSKLRELQRGRR